MSATGPGDAEPVDAEPAFGAANAAGADVERSPLEALASSWATAWEGAADGFAACCTADVAYEDPVVEQPLTGTAALAEHAAALRRAFPDLRVERVGRPLADEDYACLPWRAVGTNKAPLGGLPATNRFIAVHGLHYAELADGRVRRARGFFDLWDAAAQLGVAPRRGSLGEAALLVLRGFGLRGLS